MTRPLRRGAAVLLVAAAVLSVSGCGDDSDGSIAKAPATTAAETTEAPETTDVPETTEPPAARKPCEIVTKEVAMAILPGITFGDGIEAGQGDNISCTYPGDPYGPTAQVEVFIGAGAKKSFDIDRDELAHEFTAVDGVGDEAWYEGGNLFFRVGDLWTQLRVVNLDLTPEQEVANLTAAAKTVVERL